MIASLERVLQGIVATLRADVIPKAADDYSRGQVVGVIDLLNNIAARVEWAREPLIEGVRARREALALARDLLSLPCGSSDQSPLLQGSSPALVVERDRLDAEIADLLTEAYARAPDGEAVRVLRKQVHDDMVREMAMSRKPLFAEMTKGGAQDRDN